MARLDLPLIPPAATHTTLTAPPMTGQADRVPATVDYLLDDAIDACLGNKWLVGTWDPPMSSDDLKILARHLWSALVAYQEVVPDEPASTE